MFGNVVFHIKTLLEELCVLNGLEEERALGKFYIHVLSK
jgi:hypothetical protein